uniref:SUMO-activating enzyme subunit 1B-1 isoform X2 n=1 Tax=Rhizophora mucronata TaxID=61149 RepID=A0A2P2JSG0_RHIMU
MNFPPRLLYMQKLINEKCRKLSKWIAFYTGDCRDSCGQIFVDLQEYKCTMATIFYSYSLTSHAYFSFFFFELEV